MIQFSSKKIHPMSILQVNPIWSRWNPVDLVRSSSVLLGISLGYAAAAVGAVARQATPGCDLRVYQSFMGFK